jgi:acyl-CoA synthetase (AMP-forming)/AMP-acid ligase II
MEGAAAGQPRGRPAPAAPPLQDAWQILELAAMHFPDRLAVVDCAPSGRLLTYEQLHGRAAALAAALRRRGLRRGDRLAVLCRNGAAVLELHYAAAALHAVVVNLNIHLAPPELAYILGDAAPAMLFADRHYAAPLLAARAQWAAAEGVACEACEVTWIDVDPRPAAVPADVAAAGGEYEAAVREGAAAGGLGAAPLEAGSLEDGFHMYYTSGTTGRPKGLVLSHRIVVHHAVAAVKGPPPRAGGAFCVHPVPVEGFRNWLCVCCCRPL